MSTAVFVSGSQVSAAQAQIDPGYRLLTLGERITRAVLGRCDHNHSWPVASTEISYPDEYNSHQNCPKCGDGRLYDSRTMTPGPSFIRTNLTTR